MIKINNREIISKLAKKIFKSNVRRNVIVIFAVVLTTLMLVVEFSVGMSYIKSIYKRSLSIEGLAFDVYLSGPTDKQIKKAASMKNIKYAGNSVGCGTIKEFRGIPISTKMIWSDTINWKKQYTPAFEFLKGKYPKKKNEILLSTKTLEKYKIERPKIGMELDIKYTDFYETKERKMILSGYYKDYSNENKTFISKSLFETTGHKKTDVMRSQLFLTLKKPWFTDKDISELKDDFILKSKQGVYGDTEKGLFYLKSAIGVLGVSVLIIMSGYFLIYNVLYISISKEIRFFGLLKTIGTTSEQIRSLVYKQVLRLSSIGIPLGLTLGGTISLVIVPLLLKNKRELGDISEISFHPIIFIGAGVFSLFIVIISSLKPIKLAGNISPIEAVKYVVEAEGAKKEKNRRSRNGGKLYHMAWRNIFREKKRAVVVFLSLFVGLTTFVCFNTIIKTNGAKNVLEVLWKKDIKISNKTLAYEEKPVVQKIDDTLLKSIGKLDGIKSINKVSADVSVVPYQEMLAPYFKNLYKTQVVGQSYNEGMKLLKKHPEKFYGYMVGIGDEEFDEINKKLDKKIDKEDFVNGKVCLIQVSDFLEVSLDDIIGKNIKFILPKNSSKKENSLKIGEITEISVPTYAGFSPDIYVSNKAAEKLLKEPTIDYINIDYKKSYDRNLEKNIKSLIVNDKEIDYDSKIDSYDNMIDSERNLLLIGNGLTLTLAVLGILNYANMMTTGIQNRRKEFAILQSIGMTTKQLKKMLFLEGLGYGIISIALVGTLGAGITYGIFELMNEYKVEVIWPVLTVTIVFGTILIVCGLIPIIIYRIMQRGSIAEQVKKI